MNTGSTNPAPDTSTAPALDIETAIRRAAEQLDVDVTAAPSPLDMGKLFTACVAAECDTSDVIALAEHLMKKDLPTFGFIQIERSIGALGACLGHLPHEEIDDMDPATLRELAADALAAAKWLEAHAVSR